ncbi:Glutamate--cysteine ligase catalytic subunit [Schistosoma japonicum]|nr:Glutamate--cysteine ligase catalytic subunit [Schistosoma japonicum]
MDECWDITQGVIRPPELLPSDLVTVNCSSLPRRLSKNSVTHHLSCSTHTNCFQRRWPISQSFLINQKNNNHAGIKMNNVPEELWTDKSHLIELTKDPKLLTQLPPLNMMINEIKIDQFQLGLHYIETVDSKYAMNLK